MIINFYLLLQRNNCWKWLANNSSCSTGKTSSSLSSSSCNYSTVEEYLDNHLDQLFQMKVDDRIHRGLGALRNHVTLLQKCLEFLNPTFLPLLFLRIRQPEQDIKMNNNINNNKKIISFNDNIVNYTIVSYWWWLYINDHTNDITNIPFSYMLQLK